MIRIYNKVNGVISKEFMLVPESVLEYETFITTRRVEEFLAKIGYKDYKTLTLVNSKNTIFALNHDKFKGYSIRRLFTVKTQPLRIPVESLKNVIDTPKGEKVFSPAFGGDLTDPLTPYCVIRKDILEELLKQVMDAEIKIFNLKLKIYDILFPKK